jgi:uncharacterized protein YceK
MARSAIRLAVVLAAACLGGCGTMENLVGIVGDHGDREVYGGVVHSVEFARYTTKEVTEHAAKGVTDLDNLITLPLMTSASVYFWGVDTPLSAVADTLTLPITIVPVLEHWKNERLWRIEPAPPPREPSLESWLK